MDTHVDPLNYRIHHENEAHISSPHHVFIKSEPPAFDATFTEETPPINNQMPFNIPGVSTFGQHRNQLQSSIDHKPIVPTFDQTGVTLGTLGHATEQKIIASFGQRLLQAQNDGIGQETTFKKQGLSVNSLGQTIPSTGVPIIQLQQQTLQDINKVHIGQKRIFPCEVCNKVFGQKYNLTRHMLLHSKDRKYSCEVCARTYVEKYQLTKHMMTHKDKKPFACHICHKDFVLKYMLKNHMMTHTGDKPFACACGLRFSQIGALNRHRSGKFTKRSFQCDYCMKIFKQKTHLIRHIAFHTGEKRYSCDICNKKFSQQSNLYTHRSIHTSEKRFSCDVCYKKFRNSQHLSRHKNVHLKTDPSRENAINPPVLTKTEIDRKVVTEYDKSQMQVNQNMVFIKSEPPDISDTCDVEIVKQESIEETDQKNEPQVSTEKPQGCPFAQTEIELPEEYLEKKRKKSYPCDVCKKVFFKPFHLKRHKVIHSDDRPFSCTVCKKTFHLKMHLNCHMKTHSGLKPFCCDICNTSFNRKWPLARHMQLLHSDDTRFSCNKCNKTFGKESHLVKHQKRACKTTSELKKLKMDERVTVNCIDRPITRALDYEMKQPHEMLKIEMNDGFSDNDDNIHDRYLDHQKPKLNLGEYENIFICDRCDCIFKDKQLLIVHLEEKCHKTLTPCKYCSKLVSETYLEIHEKIHKGEEIKRALKGEFFSCNICTKTFTNNSDLVEHEFEHKKNETESNLAKHEKNCENYCDIFEESFTENTQLIEHKLKHKKKKPLHECKFCKKKFLRGDLTRHILIHTGQRPYQCEICYKTFPQKGNLKAHRITHSNEKPYGCSICQKEFNSFQLMKQHKDTHVNDPSNMFSGHSETGDLQKQDSSQTSNLQQQLSGNFQGDNLAGHSTNNDSNSPYIENTEAESMVIKIEPDDMPLTYEDDEESQESSEFIVPEQIETSTYVDCPATDFRTKLNFGGESQNMENGLTVFCDQCHRGFKLKRYLIRHLHYNKCAEAKRFACKFCLKLFAKSYIKHHERTHTGERPYSCKVCAKTFVRSSHLSTHKNTHSEKRPHICEVCYRSFNQRNHLKRHLLTHNEKKFSCNICDKKFSRNSYLVEHKRIHSGEKLFSCDVCEKSFFRSCSLAQHKLIHNKEKPFECEICKKKFAQKIHLQLHELVHDTEKAMRCNICDKRFYKKRNLVKHQKIHKKDNTIDVRGEIERIENESDQTSQKSSSDLVKKEPQDSDSQFVTNLGNSSTAVIVKIEPENSPDTLDAYNIKQEPQEQIDDENCKHFNEATCTSTSEKMGPMNDENSDHHNETPCFSEKIEQENQITDDKFQYDCEENSNCDETETDTEKEDKYSSDCNEDDTNSTNTETNAIADDLTCEVCHKTFKKRRNLVRHKVCHTDEKTFVCNVCSKAFARGSTLKRHQQIHTNAKRHVCELCDKSFSQKYHLEKHFVVHTQERNYDCDVCHKKFTQKSALNRHKLSHGDKRHMCNICQKTFTRRHHLMEHKFTRSHHLMEHKLTHSEEKPISCDKCDMKFTFRTAFRRHRRLEHSSEMPDTYMEEEDDDLAEKLDTDNLDKKAVTIDDNLVKKADTTDDNLAKKADTIGDNFVNKADTIDDNLAKKAVTIDDNLAKKADTIHDNLAKKADTNDDNIAKKADTINDNLAKKADCS